MVTDVVTLWNLALSAAGGRVTLSSETEPGFEADLCRLWYPLVRDVVLKAASWPSTKAYARLALLAERLDNTEWDTADPSPTWRYAYAAPSDMIAPRNLVSFSRFDRSLYNGNVAIMCNEAQAILHYSQRQENVSKWDTGLTMAVVYGMAANITLGLTGKRTLFETLMEVAESHVLTARTNVANESDDNYASLPSWVEKRGFTELPRDTYFVWPYENLNAIGA